MTNSDCVFTLKLLNETLNAWLDNKLMKNKKHFLIFNIVYQTTPFLEENGLKY